MPHKDPEAAKAWRRQWWANRADMRDKQRIGARDRARALRLFLNEIKVGRGCIDCGYRAHPAALDFDHVSGTKKRLVSFAKSKAQALTEIEKCEVRCSNCHRVKTWERRTNKRPCKPGIFELTYESDEEK